jgi:hypothetical protein
MRGFFPFALLSVRMTENGLCEMMAGTLCELFLR